MSHGKKLKECLSHDFAIQDPSPDPDTVFLAGPDPGGKNNAGPLDPDPQHWFYIRLGLHRIYRISGRIPYIWLDTGYLTGYRISDKIPYI